MDDLLERAPEAHGQLAGLNEEQQEEIASRILQLTHRRLVSIKESYIEFGDEVEVIPPAEFDTHQSEEHSRVTALMTEASRLTSAASAELDKQPITETSQPIGPNEVFKQAKSLALQEAEAAKAGGDKEQTKNY